MRKASIILFIFFLFRLITQALPAGAESAPNRDAKAGVFNFKGYHSLNEKGGLEGYGIDLLSMLSKYSHLNFDLVGYERSWHDMLDMLKNGEIDLVSSASRVPEREEDFVFSLPVGRKHTVLSKKLTNSKLQAGNYRTYNGIKVGILEGGSQNKDLEDFARHKGFKYETVEFESPIELTDALQSGKVDAILTSSLRKPENETDLDIIDSDNFYIIARKTDQDLIDEINYAIEQMNRFEGDWQNEFFFKHFGAKKSENLSLTDREKAFIKISSENKKPVTVLSRDNMPPYSYREGDVLKGILPDYFREIMKEAGLPYEFITPRSYEDYKEKAEKAQVILDRIEPALIEDDMRMSRFNTEPYVMAGLAKVEKLDFSGPERIIALPEHPPFTLPVKLTEGRELRYYPSADAAMEAVQRGEADTAYTLPLAAQIFINRSPNKDLIYSLIDKSGAHFRMHVLASGSHELFSIIRKIIKNMPPSKFNELISRYSSISARDLTLRQYLEAHPNLLFYSALAIILTASAMIIIILHSRWSRRLLAATERANKELCGQMAVVEALSRSYENILAVNANDGSTRIIKITDKRDMAWPEEIEIDYGALIEKYIDSRAHPDDRAELRKALSLKNVLSRLAKREEYSGSYRAVKNGRTEYFQYAFVWPGEKAESDDNLILAGFRNIDTVVRQEQEQKKILEDALEKSRCASAAKTAFLNNMSHDIRTPMNAIIGFTDLAASNAENAALVRRYLGKIKTSGGHLLRLINDVLNMSRIESGKVKIKMERVSLAQILRELQTIVQSDIHTKKLDFRLEGGAVINEAVWCDRLRLNQVLLNVISNAIKYTPEGGRIRVSVEQKKNRERGHADYEFRVIDNGIGMSPEFLKRVFEPFEREQTSTVSGIEGSGLGMAITKKIAELMGGSVEAESEPGKGSVFILSFSFPVSEDTAEEAPAGVKRVLIAHKERIVRENIIKIFSRLGIKTDEAANASEALRLAENTKPDLCLAAWSLPDDPDGGHIPELRQALGGKARIVVMCPPEGCRHEEEKKRLGADAFCQTPAFMSEVIRILAQAPEASNEGAGANARDSFKGRRVLLVEDNEMNQEIAQMILEDAGFEVEIAENGKEAVDKISSKPAGAYDLVLMDVQMPVMNGYQATREIRAMKDPAKASVSIIAMTANAFDEDKEEAARSGMNGYVAKPIDIKSLLDTLEESVRGAGAGGGK